MLLERGITQSKLLQPRDGPYTVQHVNSKGTVKIQKGAVRQTVNIRRLTPYFSPAANSRSHSHVPLEPSRRKTS